MPLEFLQNSLDYVSIHGLYRMVLVNYMDLHTMYCSHARHCCRHITYLIRWLHGKRQSPLPAFLRFFPFLTTADFCSWIPLWTIITHLCYKEPLFKHLCLNWNNQNALTSQSQWCTQGFQQCFHCVMKLLYYLRCIRYRHTLCQIMSCWSFFNVILRKKITYWMSKQFLRRNQT